jgi:hypothetical protein
VEETFKKSSMALNRSLEIKERVVWHGKPGKLCLLLLGMPQFLGLTEKRHQLIQ